MFHKSLFSLKRLSYLIWCLFFFSLFYNCENEVIDDPVNAPVEPVEPEMPEEPEGPVSMPLSHNDSVAISKLPRYYNFLTAMKESGYTFFDFRTYISTDTALLPQKLIVVRHDIHYRDIKWAYYAFQIEQIVIGARHSTFYIMLNDSIELALYGYEVQNLYMNLIHHLDSNGVDIQPHISPVDLYIEHIIQFGSITLLIR
jgi:hypothetical protein